MKYFLPKEKLFFKTQQNIYDRFFEYSVHKKKWFFYKKKNKYLPKPISFTVERPRSLKHLYKERLLTRQKIKNFYGCLTDKKLKKSFKQIKQNKFSINNFFIKMEQRLDILLFRSHLFFGLFEIQQKIRHKQIKVNGKIIKTVGYNIKPGDCIEIPSNISSFTNNKLRLPPYLGWNSALNA